jgi:hypothetical protein
MQAFAPALTQPSAPGHSGAAGCAKRSGDPMKKAILILLVLTSGCFAEVEETPAPAPGCPVVECAFLNGACDPERNTYASHVVYDDGAGCWHRTAACYPKGTPAGCEPADCYSETSLACGAEGVR